MNSPLLFRERGRGDVRVNASLAQKIKAEDRPPLFDKKTIVELYLLMSFT
jgi:hypothetical protein